VALTGYAALQWLGHTFGATAEERHRDLPGDDLIRRPRAVTTHAITIDAPRASVWPWLVQMGWHRGGWYTARWVDRLLFPDNAPSAQHLLPELQRLAVGDTVPDGAPETGCEFVVARLDPERLLVLRSDHHLPASWTELGAWIDWSWAFVLGDAGAGRTRLVVRSRFRAGPWWVAAVYRLAIVPADFVMARQMLRGVAARAERTTAREVAAARADRASAA
jgi:hypothetical protein